jgi:hypothetical protein
LFKLSAAVAGVFIMFSLAGLAGLGCGGGGEGQVATAPVASTPTATERSTGQTLEGEGYSFTYPDGWVNLGAPQGEPGAQSGDYSVLSDVTVAPDRRPELGYVSLEVTRTNLSLTEGNIDQYSGQLADLVRGLLRQLDGQITSGPTRETVGGLPAIAFEGSYVTHGTPVQARLAFAWDGRTEYYFDCEFTPARAEEIRQGCAQVMESFKVE